MLKLVQWKNKQNLSWKEAAEKLGISRGYLHNLCTGQKLPSVELMIRIERVTGAVRWSDWKPEAQKFFPAHAVQNAANGIPAPSQSNHNCGRLL
ncbi:MAG: helix-turn-helix transcriptional regulator [Pseudomonadota bacterium]